MPRFREAARRLLELPAEDDPVALGQSETRLRAPARAFSTMPARSLPATLAVSIASRWTFSRRTRPGPEVEADARDLAEPDDRARRCRDRQRLEIVPMEPQPLRESGPRPASVSPPSTISPATAPWNSASTDCAMSAGVRP